MSITLYTADSIYEYCLKYLKDPSNLISLLDCLDRGETHAHMKFLDAPCTEVDLLARNKNHYKQIPIIIRYLNPSRNIPTLITYAIEVDCISMGKFALAVLPPEVLKDAPIAAMGLYQEAQNKLTSPLIYNSWFGDYDLIVFSPGTYPKYTVAILRLMLKKIRLTKDCFHNRMRLSTAIKGML
jgi:hypothetical protein